MNPAEHLRPETCFGYEHHLLSAEEIAAVHAHIASCEGCRRKLAAHVGLDDMAADIRSALSGGPEAQARRPYWTYAWAATILLAIGASIWFFSARQPEHVREALSAGTIPLPDFLKDLNPPKEVLMGSQSPAAGGALISPKGTAVLASRPEFQWRTLAGEWTYKVQVFTVDGELVAESGELQSSTWSPQSDLRRGVTLQWQVAATKGSDRMTMPQPPETPPRFRVVDSDTAGRLKRLPGSHVERAVEYARAGVLDAAREEMTAAVAERPGDEDRRRLLQFLER